EIARYEGIAIDDDALAAIAYRADGGLRDALTMLEQAAAFADGAITTGTIDLAFGATGRNFAGTLIDAVIARDAAQAMRTIEESSDAGTDMQVLIRALIVHFRNLLVARIDPALLARDLAPEDAERATERAQGMQQASVVRALRILSDAASLARTGGNPRLELETALLRFMLEGEAEGSAPVARPAVVEKAPPPPPPAPVQEREPEPEPEPQPEPEPIPTPAPMPQAQSKGEVSIQKVRAAWTNIRGKAESERPPLRAPLSGAMVAAVDGNAVVLKLRTKFDADILKDHLKLLERAIHDVLGAELKVRLESGAPAATQAAPDEPMPQFEESVDQVDEDPDALFNYANERIK
ncbi:MAG: hypothetical protein KGN02_02620, partial [bacterium]|nr:hypothetical protein [bacterium]